LRLSYDDTESSIEPNGSLLEYAILSLPLLTFAQLLAAIERRDDMKIDGVTISVHLYQSQRTA
jgi:hypothetical protein